jgi:hypothetical protein
MTATFDAHSQVGYNASVKETKTERVNATLKPSVKTKLGEIATVLRLSEADALAEAITYLRQRKDIREALQPKEQ